MSLKSIQSNYVKLLQVFKEAGVTINESQKEILDNFVSSIEETLTKTRDEAIRMTRKMVEEKLEKEYKTVVESIIEHSTEHQALADKIQTEVNSIKNDKDITEGVDQFLTEYVEEILPKKEIVDYERLQKLEQIHESLKNMLCLKDSEINDTKDEKQQLLVKENQELKQKIEEDEKKLENCEKELEESKCKDFIETKTKDLTIAEAEKIKEKAKNMSLKDLQEKFQSILEETTNDIEAEKENSVSDGETNLEEALTSIMEADKNNSSSTEENNNNSGNDNEDETQDETASDGSVQITEAMMQTWIDSL